MFSLVFVAALQASSPDQIGPWTVRKSADPVTDVVTVSFLAGTPTDNFGIGCRAGDPSTTTVVWRGNRAFQSNGGRFAIGGMTYRFDTDEPQHVVTLQRDGQRQAEINTGADIRKFMDRIGTSSRLVLRDTLASAPARTAIFNYTADEADRLVQRVNAECGTKFPLDPDATTFG